MCYSVLRFSIVNLYTRFQGAIIHVPSNGRPQLWLLTLPFAPLTMTDAASKAAGRVLLPDNIVPSRYELKIKPDLDAFTFEGECKIVLHTTSASGNEIKLHAKELCFSKANFILEGSEEAPVECEEVSLMWTS